MFLKGGKVKCSLSEQELDQALRKLRPERQRDLLEALSRQHGRKTIAKFAARLGYLFK